MRKEIFIDLLVIVLLIIISFAIQIVFLNPPILSDQMEYFFTAVKFPYLPDVPNHWSMRIGLILPAAILFRIFGYAEISYYLVPLASMAFLAISIYLIGGRMFNRVVGIFSALWTILIPSLMLESGHLLPDLPATACFSAGIAVLLFTENSNQTGTNARSEKCKKWLFFLAGLLFGWSYLTKEYMAVLFVLIPLFFWAFGLPYRYLVILAAGMALTIGIEFLIGILYYQNALVRFSTVMPRETVGMIEMDVRKIIGFFPALIKRYGGEGTWLLSILAMLTFGYQIFKRDKRFLFLFLWVMVFYVFFTLVGLMPVIFSWKDAVLIRLHKFRYWIPILPPLIIGGIAALDNLFKYLRQKIKWRLFKTIILGPLFILAFLSVSAARGIISIRDHPDLIRNGRDHYLELRAYLKENNDPNAVIWIDRDNNRAFERILPMYIHDFWGRKVWDGKFKYLNTQQQYLSEEEINEGFVILDRDFYNTKFYDIPKYLEQPPESWRMVFESENNEIALYAVK